jgi:hypothetical protein
LIWINEISRLQGFHATKLLQFAGTEMCRIRLSLSVSLLVTALTAAPWSSCQAAGSFQTKSAFLNVVSASYSTPSPAVSVAHTNMPVIEFGCGKGRIRDSQTHGCRGPADIR